MKIEKEDPASIEIPPRLRAVVPAKVDQLAESMATIGMQTPIHVWSDAPGHLELVAGAHRLAAAIKLGWAQIDVISVDDMDGMDRQLWEIDENLIRAELSAAENADHIVRRKELWAERSEVGGKTLPTHDATGRKKTPQQTKGFAADTAKKTGMSKRAINLALARAKAIPADIRDQIKYTKLDTGTYLDSLKGMESDDQRAQVKADLAEPSVQQDAEIRAFNRAYAARGKALRDVQLAWRRASADDRRRIKKWVADQETPASDDGGGDA